MRAIYFSLCFSVLLTFPFWIACSSGVQQYADSCEKHPQLRVHIDKYLSQIERKGFEGKKTVSSDDKVETVDMTADELIDSYSILFDVDIDLPNLIGKYGCNSIIKEERRIESFFALDSKLTIRHLELTYKDEDLIFLAGNRKVGSVLARIDQNLEWDINSGKLTIQVDYRNLFGREYFYEIDFIPVGVNNPGEANFN